MNAKLKGILIIGAGLFGLAQAATAATWNLTGTALDSTAGSTNYSNGSGAGTLPNVGNTVTLSGGAGNPTVTLQAWANTDQSNGGGVSASTTLGGSSNSSGYELETAYLAKFSSYGYGVENRDYSSSSSAGDQSDNSSSNSEHATDNQQRNDMILFSFSEAVSLSGLRIGWAGGDSDMTVLAYTPGTGQAQTPTLDNLDYTELTANGWSLIDHYADVSASSSQFTGINAGSTHSSYWLIGAYNPYVGGSTGWSEGNDFVKIAALTGATCGDLPPGAELPAACGGGTPSGQTPEPMTLGLLGLGLLGMLRMRRAGKGA